MILPRSVTLREEGPREGFQALTNTVSTSDKLRLIKALSETGIQSIEVTAFVRPDKVPQHADAEAVAAGLPSDRGANCPRYRALYLNKAGFERALGCGNLRIEGAVMLAASEQFLIRNNNRNLDQALEDLVNFAAMFQQRNLPFERLMISTCFGDELEGRKSAAEVLALVQRAFQRLNDAGHELPEEVTFADTTGWGNPGAVERLIGEFLDRYPERIPGLHLHDTRGTGMANVYAGLLAGVSRFDCSVGGLGGCPFAAGAAGNVPTEDVAFLCEELGISTGIDLRQYIEAARVAEEVTGAPLAGKLYRGGLLPR